MNYSRTRAFTLIELLVVVAIIGLLSSVILASLNIARSKALDSARESNLIEVQKALQAYYDDNGKYPQPGTGDDNGTCGSGATACNYASQCSVGGGVAQSALISNLVSGGYIPSLPTDSQMNTANNDCCYEYLVSTTGSDYKFTFFKGTTGTPACSTSAAGTGTLTDPARTGNAWAVYTAAASSW